MWAAQVVLRLSNENMPAPISPLNRWLIQPDGPFSLLVATFHLCGNPLSMKCWTNPVPSLSISSFSLCEEVQLDSILEAVCAQFEAVVTIEKLAVSRVRQVTATITKIKGTVARDGFTYLSRSLTRVLSKMILRLLWRTFRLKEAYSLSKKTFSFSNSDFSDFFLFGTIFYGISWLRIQGPGAIRIKSRVQIRIRSPI